MAARHVLIAAVDLSIDSDRASDAMVARRLRRLLISW
eukprot:COSAG04_NODE_25715_length_304_cov_0.668293_1_plen_36_part_01